MQNILLPACVIYRIQESSKENSRYGFCHFRRSSLNLVPEIMKNATQCIPFEVVCITIYAPIIDVWQRQIAFKRWHVVCSVLLRSKYPTYVHAQ